MSAVWSLVFAACMAAPAAFSEPSAPARVNAPPRMAIIGNHSPNTLVGSFGRLETPASASCSIFFSSGSASVTDFIDAENWSYTRSTWV